MFHKLVKLSRFCRSSRQSLMITLEILIGIVICLMSFLAFLYLTREVFHQDLVLVDFQFSQFAYILRTPELTIIMKFFSALGNSISLLISTLIVIILLLKKHRNEVAIFCIALIMGTVINTALKTFIARERPSQSPLVIENTYSFPSNHAMNATIFFGLISYFSFHFFRKKSLSVMISLLSILLIILIGFSRIYLGVHYFSDVMAGYFAGFWWFVTVLLVDHTLKFYKLFKEESYLK